MTKIPHLNRIPFIGNLHQLAGKDILGKMIGTIEGFYPVTELKILNRKIICITSVDLAKEVMDDEKFDKYIDLPLEYLRRAAGDGLFTAWTYEKNWKKAHEILLPGFAHKAIEGYIPLMQQTLDQLVDNWSKKTGSYFDLAEDMTKLTFETIGLCGFDYSFNSFTSEERHPFIEAMLFIFKEAIWLARTPPLLHPLRFGKDKKFKECVQYMNNILDDIIRRRKEDKDSQLNKIDFLQLMLHATDKESGQPLNDENIRYQIVTFLVAGHETTGSTIAFAFYNLLKNPEYLSLAYEEVDRVLGSDKNKILDQYDFKELKFIRQVLFETLRLYPPLIGFSRYSPVDTFIGEEKYPVEANQSIYVMPYFMHRDKKHWGENPELFNPTHFSPEAILKRDKEAFKAFGHGNRACIGQHFAMMEATLAIAKILQNFELSLREGYQIQFLESPAMKPKNLEIKVQLRK
jgi:cytochrome P450/NADPH-cytochrome P450 reductase